MIVGKAAHEMAASYPHEMDPNPAHPYVMFPGTKYQHLMLPADMGTGHGQASTAASWPAAADFLARAAQPRPAPLTAATEVLGGRRREGVVQTSASCGKIAF
ncbi:hypothetical protein AOX55_0000771 [Sinorhizobium fredii CCBAU 25509]|nr:hypothetical protein AOX55_0000771 [Sinorhizobium fredii CCBAU 25509]